MNNVIPIEQIGNIKIVGFCTGVVCVGATVKLGTKSKVRSGIAVVELAEVATEPLLALA